MRNYPIIFFLILFIIPVSFKNISAFDYEMDNTLDGFGWSMGLSLNDDRIYVADGLYNQILIFDKLENVFLETISLQERICSGHIHGIEIMYDKIFVVKENQNCIAIFDLDGKFLYEFGKKGDKQGEFNGPQNLQIFEEKIFVTDYENHRIQVFDLDGKFLYEFGKKGDKQGEFVRPFDIEIFEEKIFVTDSGNYRIQIFDLDGKFLYEFGKKGDKQGEFNGVLGIKVSENQIFVIDSGNNRIQIFDLDGEIVDTINENFKSPHQISLNENKIYVLDTYNYQVKIFSILYQVTDSQAFLNNELEINEESSEMNDSIDPSLIFLLIIIIVVLFMIFLRKKLM